MQIIFSQNGNQEIPNEMNFTNSHNNLGQISSLKVDENSSNQDSDS